MSVVIRQSLAGLALTCLFLGVAGQTNGDITLYRNGKTSGSFSSGRVLIYAESLDVWGSIKNDDYFDLKAATVICQQLQFDGAYGYSDATHDSFGGYLQPLVMQQVICDDDKYLHILQCDTQDTFLHNYQHDLSVFCRSVPIWDNPFTGQVRLQDGVFPSQGRVEIYCNGKWGTICAEGFDEDDARKVCQQLGYSDQQEFNSLVISSPSTSMPVWMEQPGCTALEPYCLTSCQQCPASPVKSCPFSQGEANVACVFLADGVPSAVRDNCDTGSDHYTSSPSNGELVRADADLFNQSLLIYYNEKWNFLCGDSFSQAEADVACRHLGYPGGASDFTSSVWKDLVNVTPMGVVQVDCTTTPDENLLLRCHVVEETTVCQKIVRLSCRDNDLYTPYEGEIRLVGGQYPSEGRVEMFLNDQWGTVCSAYVDGHSADVMCRQIGYTNSITFSSNIYPGDDAKPIWVYLFDCTNINVCFSSCLSSIPTSTLSDCSHSQDTFVKCDYSVDLYGTGSQDECEIDISVDATPSPSDLETSSSPSDLETSSIVVELAASVIGAFIFLLLLISCAIIVTAYILKSRQSARIYRRLQEEGTGMQDVVADGENTVVAHRPTRTRTRVCGLSHNPNLPSLQFSYALVVPPEEEYSPSFDDPIPDEPPPAYTPPEDPQILHSVQTSSPVASSLPDNNHITAVCTVDPRPDSES